MLGEGEPRTSSPTSATSAPASRTCASGSRALSRVDQQLAAESDRIDGCIAYRSLIRYDAYGEMSGHQSSSLALLDARRSGVVISSILHRDQARVYVKQLHEGGPTLELSPEEQEAVDTALAGGRAHGA